MEQREVKILKELLFSSVKESLGRKKEIAIFFSGGIDSSLLAFTSFKLGTKVTSITIGSNDSKDVNFVRSLVKKLPFKSIIKTFNQEDLKKVLPQVEKLLGKAGIEANLMQISLATGFFLSLKEIKKTGLSLVFSGQGGDELFAGGFRALKIPLKELNSFCQKELQRLKTSDFKREKEIADFFGLTVKYPFCDQKIIDFALALPPEMKLMKLKNEVIRKYILRKLGGQMGLPIEIVNRPKEAFQYSSRVQKEIEKIWKQRQISK